MNYGVTYCKYLGKYWCVLTAPHWIWEIMKLNESSRDKPGGSCVSKIRMSSKIWELLNLRYCTKILFFHVWVRYFVWNFKSTPTPTPTTLKKKIATQRACNEGQLCKYPHTDLAPLWCPVSFSNSSSVGSVSSKGLRSPTIAVCSRFFLALASFLAVWITSISERTRYFS